MQNSIAIRSKYGMNRLENFEVLILKVKHSILDGELCRSPRWLATKNAELQTLRITLNLSSESMA